MTNTDRHIHSMPNRLNHLRTIWDSHTRLACIAINLYDAADEIAAKPRDQAEADILTPPFAHIHLSVDTLATVFYEIQQFGLWKPEGRAPLRIASNQQANTGLRKAA